MGLSQNHHKVKYGQTALNYLNKREAHKYRTTEMLRFM